jgi:hypothetical protein
MEVKVQQMVALDEEAFDEVLVKYLRQIIEQAEDEGCKYGPDPYIIEAMKVTHDWFAMPSDWYNTPLEMEMDRQEFKEQAEKLTQKAKPAKMKAKGRKLK